MKLNKYKNKIKNKNNPGNRTPCHFSFSAGSFAVHIGDRFRFGIICGPIWGSFSVWGSFAVRDHLRRCTGLLHVWNLSQARDNAPAFRSRLLLLQASNSKHILCILSPLLSLKTFPVFWSYFPALCFACHSTSANSAKL